jgi:hypothetical protein
MLLWKHQEENKVSKSDLQQAIYKIMNQANDFGNKHYKTNLDNEEGIKQPTSLEAKQSMRPFILPISDRVLLELYSEPSTDDELEQRMQMRHQTLSSSRRHCVIKGWVTPTGGTRLTRSGRKANVWQLTYEGRLRVKQIKERKGQ